MQKVRGSSPLISTNNLGHFGGLGAVPLCLSDALAGIGAAAPSRFGRHELMLTIEAGSNRFVLEQRATFTDIEARPRLAALAQKGRTARLGDAFQKLGGAGLDLGAGDKKIQHGHIVLAGGLAAGAYVVRLAVL
jgi:hypothetical protein